MLRITILSVALLGYINPVAAQGEPLVAIRGAGRHFMRRLA
jgi:hypothetical protein